MLANGAASFDAFNFRKASGVTLSAVAVRLFLFFGLVEVEKGNRNGVKVFWRKAELHRPPLF